LTGSRSSLTARIGETLLVSRAMAAGLTDRPWDMADIVRLVDEASRKQRAHTDLDLSCERMLQDRTETSVHEEPQ
jgi:hypothetical protein